MTNIRWQGPPLCVIGVSSEPPSLPPAATSALTTADLVICGERHFEILQQLINSQEIIVNPDLKRVNYPSPFSLLWDFLLENQHQRIVLLASGDPLLFGLGGFLRQRISHDKLIFFPSLSSVQVAFSRIGEAWQDAKVVSLHGRPLQGLRAKLQKHRLYALLTDANSHPVAIARELVQAGLGESQIWVCEDLGTEQENVSQHCASELAASTLIFSSLNVVIIKTLGSGGRLPEFPGIPDDQFSTDNEQAGQGLITKREVRLCALSLLQPCAGEIGWDVGAGCGGVSVEWARWSPRSHIHAVEYHADRLHHLQINRERFGVMNNLHVCAGRAPDALSTLPCADAIFVGGGGKDLPVILDACWSRLTAKGRLVAAAVTADACVNLHLFAQNDPHVEWTEIRISRNALLAQQRLMRPQLPVLLMKRVKP